MKIANKNFLVAGLGISGAAAARFLKKRGAAVTVTDMAPASHECLASYVPSMREMDISMEFGEHRIESFESADVIVISPGVPHTIPPVKAARKKGIPVMGEIELASRFIDIPIVAVTGTNGKTTTTTLLGKMLEHSGLSVFVGGNIGEPLIGYVDENSPFTEHPQHPLQREAFSKKHPDGKKADVIVAEISSFQLDTIHTFRPGVAVLLNITEDHLDRYPNFAAYAASKARIFENQQENDVAVLNSNDPLVRSVTRNIKSRKLETGSSFKFPIPSSLPGRHNMENISAAYLAAKAAGGTPTGIQEALNHFRGLPHRTEYVGTINKVKYYNDSKATNTDAVLKALECFDDRSVILIMGGRGKGNGFHVLREAVRGRVKMLIAMGEIREEIESSLGDVAPAKIAADMKDAVRQAYHAATPGDTVLLSPACSSFDMYASYADRGKDFCQQVGRLEK